MTTLQERLTRLKNYSTRYEVSLSHANGQRYLWIYTPSVSRSELWRIMGAHGPKLGEIVGAGERMRAVRSGKWWALVAGNGWTLGFTGRTQRDAYIGGELPFVLDVAAESVGAA
jgi:hypothetical protein